LRIVVETHLAAELFTRSSPESEDKSPPSKFILILLLLPRALSIKLCIGIVGIVTKNTVGRINDGFNYTKVDAGLVQTIKSQTGENEEGDIEGSNIYSGDLQLIVNNGDLSMVIKV